MVFIREHTIEVLNDYVKILERSAQRGNPPDVQADLDEGRQRLRKVAETIQAVRSRSDADIRALIQEFRESRHKEAPHAGNHGRQ